MKVVAVLIKIQVSLFVGITFHPSPTPFLAPQGQHTPPEPDLSPVFCVFCFLFVLFSP